LTQINLVDGTVARGGNWQIDSAEWTPKMRASGHLADPIAPEPVRKKMTSAGTNFGRESRRAQRTAAAPALRQSRQSWLRFDQHEIHR
jgi:hypothetical protein